MNESRTSENSDTDLTQARSGPVRAPKGPHVYFIRADDAVKIGFSEIVGKRFSTIQSAHAVDLELLGTVPASGGTERSYHDRFAHLHIRGEWFRAEPELLDAIAADCASYAPLKGTLDYEEMFKAFKAETKHLIGTALGFAAGHVLFRLKQLAINKTLPIDIRDWHLGIHLEGLKEAQQAFERVKAAN